MLNCAAVPHVAPCIFFPVDGCPDTLMAVLLFYSTNGCPAIHSTNGCPAILLYQWLSCYPTVPMAVLLSYCINGCPAILLYQWLSCYPGRGEYYWQGNPCGSVISHPVHVGQVLCVSVIHECVCVVYYLHTVCLRLH